jgi:hypothetical protein
VRAFASLALVTLACGAPEAVVAPSPRECGALKRADADGRCGFILPSSDCPPHSHARVGLEACQPIGAGSCTAPWVAGPGWSCALPRLDCGARELSSLTSASCEPVGWSGCPRGFVEEGAGCRPVRAARCSGATRAAIGAPDCVAVGVCDGAPAGDLFVDPSFAATDATHFRTIAAAIAAAADGATISIAAGEYDESPRIARAVSLRGACAAEVRVRGGVLVQGARDVSMSGLTIVGGRPGIRAQAGAVVSVEDVVIEGSAGAGVLVEGSELALERAVIRDVRALSGPTFGRGVDVSDGGSAIVRDVAISDVREAGVIAVGAGSELALADVVIDRARREAGGRGGFGVAAVAGARVTGGRVSISDVAELGLLAYLAESTLQLDGLFLERSSASGARAEEGGTLLLAHATMLETTGAGVLVTDAVSTASITDASIGRVRADPGTGFSAGLAAFFEGRLLAERVVVDGASFGALANERGRLALRASRFDGGPGSFGVVADGGSVELAGSTLRGHVGGAAAKGGGALTVVSSLVYGLTEDLGAPTSGVSATDATLELRDSAVVGGVGFGVLVTGTTAAARVSGVLISGQTSTARVVGQGVACGEARLELDRVRVDGVDGVGIVGTGRISVARTTITGITASRRQNGAALATGGDSRLVDVAVVDSQLAGVVLGEGRIDVDGLLVRGTQPNDEGEFGHGLLGEGTSLTARAVELRGNAAAGFAVDASGARLERSLIVGNVVGAHAQGGSRLVESSTGAGAREVVFGPDVLLLDNATRVGVGTIPLPAPFDVLPR